MGLFGRGQKGNGAKVLWAVFAVSITICVAVHALRLVLEVVQSYRFDYRYEQRKIREGGRYVSDVVGYATDYNREHGFIFDKRTGEKLLDGIEWIALPLGNDSLVCFSDGKLRGYFNANNGKVVIEPKYRHAWIFSSGVAAVEENGRIKFIDAAGNVVLDNGMTYDRPGRGYVFRNGYMVAESKENGLYGLMDKSGSWAIPAEYTSISVSDDNAFWRMNKGDSAAVLDKDLNMVIPFMEGRIDFDGQSVTATLADHSIRKYDLKGNLINDFCIYDVRPLLYKTDKYYCEEEGMIELSEYIIDDLLLCARLRYYVAGDDYCGLMTPEGHIVTKPIYEEIEAIGPDTYLCHLGNGNNMVVNGKGERVR